MTFSEIQGAKKEIEFMEMTGRTVNQLMRDLLLIKATSEMLHSLLDSVLSYTALTKAE